MSDMSAVEEMDRQKLINHTQQVVLSTYLGRDCRRRAEKKTSIVRPE